MPSSATQLLPRARRTEHAVQTANFDPTDVLFGVVKYYNQRGGRAYGAGVAENLYEAVKAFNARRP
ncbi:MAG: hypothetical protein VKN33_05655 [Candidatus Sericytochromatia bacterium]|nr:hypothetical protein [Candidatus Sericytochromatia bacterium]